MIVDLQCDNKCMNFHGVEVVIHWLIKHYFYAANPPSTFMSSVVPHLAIAPMYFSVMPVDLTIFFIVAGLARLFWVVPVIKRWSKPWYYVGIGGTVVLIIMDIIAVPGSGHPVGELDIAIELFQIVFIFLCSVIIAKKQRSNE